MANCEFGYRVTADIRFIQGAIALVYHYSAKARVITPNTSPTRPKAESAKIRRYARKLERYNGFIIQHIDNKTQFEEKISSTSLLIF